jgi:hypothetical protein
VPDPEIAAFGHGVSKSCSIQSMFFKLEPNGNTLRRGPCDSICPGRHFSKDGQFLMVSSLLATCTLTTAKDEQGKVIPMKLEMTNPILK